MRVLKPITITDSNLKSSTAIEPDASRGEVEWVARSGVIEQQLADVYSCAADNDYVYVCWFNFSSPYITKRNPSDLSVVSGFAVSFGNEIAVNSSHIYIAGSTTGAEKLNKDGTSTGYTVPTTISNGKISADDNWLYIYTGSSGDVEMRSITVLPPSIPAEVNVTVDPSFEIIGICFDDDGNAHIKDAVSKNVHVYDSVGGTFLYQYPYTKYSLGSLDSIAFTNDKLYMLEGYPNFNVHHTYFKNGTFAGNYAPGEEVILTSTHRKYIAAAYTNTQPDIGAEMTPPQWTDAGATNKYAMFDKVVSTQTESDSGDVVVEIENGTIINALAGFNIHGVTNVNVTVTSASAGEVYNEDINMQSLYGIYDHYTWCFTPIANSTQFYVNDLPAYDDATVKVTYSGSGEIGVGVIKLGAEYSLGVTLADSSSSLLDFSVVNRDEFGAFSITKRNTADLVKFNVKVPFNNALYVKDQFRDLSTVDAVWSAGLGTDDPMLVYGIYEKFVNNYQSRTVTNATVTIQGFV